MNAKDTRSWLRSYCVCKGKSMKTAGEQGVTPGTEVLICTGAELGRICRSATSSGHSGAANPGRKPANPAEFQKNFFFFFLRLEELTLPLSLLCAGALEACGSV